MDLNANIDIFGNLDYKISKRLI